MIRCDFADPLLDTRWNDRIQQIPGATFFHSSQWAQVLAETYGYSLFYGVLRDDRDSVTGLLPVAEIRSPWTGRRGICLPFSDECAPLATDSQAMELMVQNMSSIGRSRGWDYLELRGATRLPAAAESQRFFTHRIPFEGSEASQFARFKESNRRSIRKGERSELEVLCLQDADAIDIYYRLHCQTRQRHGLPPQPLNFFRSIQRHALGTGNGQIFLVRFRDRWIAGAVYLEFGERAVYKFGASDLEFQDMRPNNLLMWRAIQHYRSKGFSELSLGRTDTGDTGLLQFKRGWGAEESSVVYQRLAICKPLRFQNRATSATSPARRMMRKMPIPMLRFLGTVLYPHMA